MAEFRDLLFALQEPKELMAGIDRSSPAAGPWALFDQAVAAQRDGRDGQAAQCLRQVFELGGETRTWLWAWNGLRALGVAPSEDLVGQVWGVVVEVPMPGGLDTLAAYADGSARYINQSGKVLVWDLPPPNPLHPHFEALFPAAHELVTQWPAARPEKPPAGHVGITLLTPEGPRFATAALGDSEVSGPAAAVFSAAALMLQALVAESEKQGAPAAQNIQPAADPDLIAFKTGSGDARWQALGRIAERGSSAVLAIVPDMLSCLDGADGTLKLLIMSAFSGLGPGGIAALQAATSHPDARVRQWAGTMLAQLKNQT
ncbi:MAG: hypothetical protein HY077_08450 [Elusimicrobia bacterium]|nr:hypothetical protein [Elusimicrobiota bacterium]